MTEPTDEQIDSDLRMDGFDPDERYPEHGHDALRTAYRSGWESAAIRAGRSDGIAVDRGLLAELETISDPYKAAAVSPHVIAGIAERVRALLAAADQPVTS